MRRLPFRRLAAVLPVSLSLFACGNVDPDLDREHPGSVSPLNGQLFSKSSQDDNVACDDGGDATETGVLESENEDEFALCRDEELAGETARTEIRSVAGDRSAACDERSRLVPNAAEAVTAPQADTNALESPTEAAIPMTEADDDCEWTVVESKKKRGIRKAQTDLVAATLVKAAANPDASLSRRNALSVAGELLAGNPSRSTLIAHAQLYARLGSTEQPIGVKTQRSLFKVALKLAKKSGDREVYVQIRGNVCDHNYRALCKKPPFRSPAPQSGSSAQPIESPTSEAQ